MSDRALPLGRSARASRSLGRGDADHPAGGGGDRPVRGGRSGCARPRRVSLITESVAYLGFALAASSRRRAAGRLLARHGRVGAPAHERRPGVRPPGRRFPAAWKRRPRDRPTFERPVGPVGGLLRLVRVAPRPRPGRMDASGLDARRRARFARDRDDALGVSPARAPAGGDVRGVRDDADRGRLGPGGWGNARVGVASRGRPSPPSGVSTRRAAMLTGSVVALYATMFVPGRREDRAGRGEHSRQPALLGLGVIGT